MHGTESILALALISEDARPLWIHDSFPWIELRYLTFTAWQLQGYGEPSSTQ